MTKQYGLIGYPLSHSFSKKYFTEKFAELKITDSQYDLFPLSSIDDLPFLLDMNTHFVGLNVTIPYKEHVMRYLDEVAPSAQVIGAVNTIKIKDGKLTGYNTDAYGFSVSLKKHLNEPYTQHKALILGTGGASKAVAYVFHQLGITFRYVSRQKREHIFDYQMLDKSIIDQHTIIVNTTPLGMSPNVDEAPNIPYEYISSQHLLYDLVYNPELTLFLKKGQAQNAKIKNGLEMLHLQAERAWEIWNT